MYLDATFQINRGKADPLKGNDAALPQHQGLLGKGPLIDEELTKTHIQEVLLSLL